MRREIEIKLAVRDPRAVRRRLAELGFRRVSARYFERNALFDSPGRRLRKKGSLLRLRLQRGRSELTFKGPRVGEGRFKERVEIESRVGGGVEIGEILEALGLKVAFRYEKYRTLYGRRGDPAHAEVAFDETPIGIYLELEGPRRWIDQVARALGYRVGEYITVSYGRLYLGWCETHRLVPGDMVFRETQAAPSRARKSGRVRSK